MKSLTSAEKLADSRLNLEDEPLQRYYDNNPLYRPTLDNRI